MTKHTPGPWSISDWPKSIGITQKAGTRNICLIEWEGMSIDAEDKANAALISAAPDLLEACKLLVEYRRRNTLNFQLEKADDFIRMMQVAIDKAEGK